MRTYSIRFKLVATIFPLLLVATALILFWVHERSMRVAAGEALAHGARLYSDLESADVEKLSATLEALVNVESLKRAFEARDREGLLARARPIFDELENRYRITHWYFHEPEPARTVFLRVHRPPVFGDRVMRTTLAKAIETKAIASGKELGKTAFALRVVRPYRDGEKLIGYMELGEEIDHFLGRMKELTGDDYGLLLAKKHLDKDEWAKLKGRVGMRDDWGDLPDAVLADATVPDASFMSYRGTLDAIQPQGELLEEVTRGDRTLVRGAHPVKDAAGTTVGALLVLHDITALHEGMLAGRVGSVVAIVALLAGASMLLLLLVDRLVFGRLRRMTQRLEEVSTRLAGGDYGVGDEIKPSSNDEIGKFEEFFARFLKVVGGALRQLEERSRKTG